MMELMRSRHSVRQYKDEKIDSETINKIEEEVEKINKVSNLNIKAVFDDEKGFDSKLAKYGRFKNVKNFLILKGFGEDLSEKCGYYGEILVLKLLEMGLGSCWVALTYNKKNIKKYIEPNENLVIVISFGYGENEGYKRKRKLPKQVSNIREDSPQWFKDGVKASLLAPTAINQQKFLLKLVGDKVKAIAGFFPCAKIDLGIVKYHFELGSGKNSDIWI